MEKQRRAKARYVEKPPLNTAGPMSTRAWGKSEKHVTVTVSLSQCNFIIITFKML